MALVKRPVEEIIADQATDTAPWEEPAGMANPEPVAHTTTQEASAAVEVPEVGQVNVSTGEITPPAPQTLPAKSRSSGASLTSIAGGAIQASLEEEGFEGADIGYRSFPMITLSGLTGWSFEDSEGRQYGKEFFCYLQGMKPKFVYKQGKDDVLCYTYDHETTTNNESVAVLVRSAKAAGREVTVQEYREVLVLLHRPGEENDGSPVLLSVPKSSIERLAGYIHLLKIKYPGRPINATLTRVYVGPRIERAVQPFHPWFFAEARNRSTSS